MTGLLNIAKSFYDLNSMMVNFDKSCLITDEDDAAPIIFRNSFDNSTFSCPTISSNDSMRYLGVWISAKYNKNFIKRQIATEIASFIDKLKYKPLTDKQLRYLNNMVLIPRIEYRSKLMIFSDAECDVLYKPMRILIKQKLQLRKNIPNSTLHSKLAYGFVDLHTNATQAKIQQFINIINAPIKGTILGQSTIIRLKQLQKHYWLFDNPLICWPKFAHHVRHDNLISNIMSTYFNSNFNFIGLFETNKLFKIKGGVLPLQHIIPWVPNQLKSLKALKILFLSQISAAGSFLFNYNDIILKKTWPKSYKSVLPNWFKLLKKVVLINPVDSNRLKTEYRIDAPDFDGFNDLSIDDIKWNTGWANIWTPPDNNFYNFPIPGSPIFGKIFKLKSPAPPCLFQHFILSNPTFDPRSPSKRLNALTPCDGCSFNQDRAHFKLKKKYKILSCAAFVDPLLPNPLDSSPLIHGNRDLYVPKKSIWPLMDQAVAHFRALNNPAIPFASNIDFTFDDNILIIENLFLNSNYVNILNQFRISLVNERILKFYTDGSHLFVPAPLQSFLSFAFLLIHDSIDISFSAALPPLWANSTNAELFAFLTTLFICPFGSSITIYTDSLTLILTYNRFNSFNAFNYPALLFKTPFYIYWCFIFKLIEQNQLSVKLVKVKAHSGDPHNEKVDKLAKSTLHQTPLSLSFTHTPYLSFIPTFRSAPINKEIRPFFKDFVQSKLFNDFYHLKRNLRYNNKSINWLCTFSLINNGTPTQTSFQESYRHKRKYQLLLEELPTIEFLKITRPALYDQTWKCCRCLTNNETFDHVWLCAKNRRAINTIVDKMLQTLKDQLFIYTSSTEWSNDLLAIFDLLHEFWLPVLTSSSSFYFLDFIKGIVPSYLFRIINNFTKNKSNTFKILSSFYDLIFDLTYELIWKPRCDATIAMESAHNIKQKDKLKKVKLQNTIYNQTITHVSSNNNDHLSLFTNSFIHGRSWPLLLTQ
jgi:ribonuclease HI